MKRTQSVFMFAVLIAALSLSVAGAAEVADADWPVFTRPTDAQLEEKIKTLEGLVADIEAKKLDASYARSALVLAKDFIQYARDDAANGRPGRAAYVRSYLDESLDAAAAEARALIADPKRNRPVPRPKLKSLEIRGGALFADGTQVMLGGVGHFAKVREDLPKFPDYGFNLIQIEIGPSRVVKGPGRDDISTDRIDDDIIKALDRAAANNVKVNLLLSPHYFPGWAKKLYPAVNGCGKGFITYCTAAPEAREVLKRYLQALIPRIKDHPALQSYTLANEPMFDERSPATMEKFRLHLKKKYGDVAKLNHAWKKNYSSFDRIKVTEDFLNLNSAARYDWVLFHNKLGTEFFFWMKSVIRTMDKKTPVHIKFMDNMFDHFEAMWGIDREALEAFTEISGNDSSISYPGTGGYALYHRKNAAFFDFLKSVQPGKFVQNSENHIIADDSTTFYPEEYVRAAMWLQYLHGMAASTIWVWERGDGFTLGNNILSRPNCAAGAARATLDVRRLAPYVTALANADSSVALYYSNTARILQRDFEEKWNAAYEQALFQGQPVRMITDKMLEAGADPKKARLLIVPEYAYITDGLYDRLVDFVKRGGRVVAYGSLFRFNEQGRKRDTAAWDALACPKYPKWGKGCVYAMPSLTSAKFGERAAAADELQKLVAFNTHLKKPALSVKDVQGRQVMGVEYRIAKRGGRNVAYIFNSLDKNAELRLSNSAGSWATATDLINGRPVTQKLTLKPMELVLFVF